MIKSAPPSFPRRFGAVRIFTKGGELFTDYFEELKRAKDYIHVIFYILKEDALSKEFLEILVDKARSGVEVRLLVDWAGGRALKKKTITTLKEEGIKFAFTHKPTLPYLFFTLQSRNHRKITIIDGKLGYLGGYNVGNEYIGGNPKLAPWRDYHLKLYGESIQDLQQVFLDDWKNDTGEDLRNVPLYQRKNGKGPALHQLVPTLAGTTLEDMYLETFERAKERIIIGTPYFIPSKKLFYSLQNCLERGVALSIIVPGNSDHPLVKEAAYPYFRVLIKKGARVYQFMNGFYHAKTLLIDQTVCDIGTANFDKRSLFLNSEINCYMYSQEQILEAESIIQADIASSRELELAWLETRDFGRSVKELAGRVISPFL
ncbi:cardiolipin synthase [Bacillus sp. FJAT-18017]|uniref:cardiolipin synthase n=1 Tax=Bacillus sp. FJAT-18017 TaxID=1705566 RepID=UPI0009EA866E|nr:cardiolipin synthase [Bacillus sp. FJAT-18017]